MRFKNSVLDSIAGVAVMLISGLLSFIKISLIISTLGNNINGLNNLNSQIFNFLMIGEAGLGVSTTTILYKHIANNDKIEINKLISGSQQAISIIVAIILSLASFVSIFIHFFIKDNYFSNLYISTCFILYALKILIPLIFQPIKSYAMANQDEYYLNFLKIISVIFVSITEIIFVVLFRNYIQVLIAGSVSTLISETLIFLNLKRKYPNINLFEKRKSYAAVKSMKELLKINIVGTIAQSADPLIISRFLGLAFTSFYSNYSYIQIYIQSVLGSLLGAATHAFGDMFVRKEADLYKKFNMYIMLSNFVASTAALIFYCYVQEFIPLWVGKTSLLSQQTALFFSIYIYMYTSMRPMNTLVMTNGFFRLASKSAIYETMINVIVSIILINIIGVLGVLIGSVVSYLVASFWFFPVNTYRKVFGKSSNGYFKRQALCLVLLIPLYILINLISNNIHISSFFQFFVLLMLGSIVIMILNISLYFLLLKEFRLLLKFIKNKFQIRSFPKITKQNIE